MTYETDGSLEAASSKATHQPPTADAGLHAFFLDFDGVLVEIAETPDGVRAADGVTGLLNRLHDASGGALALVSGREVAQLRHHLPGVSATLVGGHGAERGRPDGGIDALAKVDETEVARLQHAVRGFAAGDPAYLVETKATGVVLHFRRKPGLAEEAERFVAGLLADTDSFHLHHAKMALELRPDGISKRQAVHDLMREAPFEGRTPVYFGDDTTDEPALADVAAAGGIAVKVGEGATAATYRVSGPTEVADWLRAVVAAADAR